MKKISPALFFLSLLLGACAPLNGTQIPSSMSTFDQLVKPEKGEQIAVIETTKGAIKMKFFPQFAPETVKNFVELTKKGFFDGLTFHRVIPDFMIQGGDPLGNGLGGETYKGPNTTLPGEVAPQLHHIHGAVSMANKGDPATASSQFFIVQNKNDAPFLDGGYTIFGQVFEGFDVIDAIVNVPRNKQDKPTTPIVMKKVVIETIK